MNHPCVVTVPDQFDIAVHGAGLELLSAPVWLYDCKQGSNVWGNRAALRFFDADENTFRQSQFEKLQGRPQHELVAWKALNENLQQDVEGLGKSLTVPLSDADGPLPGCPSRQRAQHTVLFRPVDVLINNVPKRMAFAQLTPESMSAMEDNHLRLVEICQNHPMFQFLFADDGHLLAANQRAMTNMREHLGSCENYTLQMYLSIGECDGVNGPDEMYHEAMHAIFVENKSCHRFAQLRWSKRHEGKYRWVLYEMWPLTDPVTGKRAVLVCEQNITQVKALEENFKKQNKRLEAQLEEALAQRDPMHKPAIDIDTPADKTLKLLDKLMRGLEVTPRDAMELRDAILHAGDLRQPVNFKEQLMRNSQTVLDNEVSQSLIQLLSSQRLVKEDKAAVVAAVNAGRGLSLSAQGSSRNLAQHIKHSPVREADEEGEEGAEPAAHGDDAPYQVMHLCKSMPDEVASVLAKVDDWQFDAFKLSEVSEGRPLSLLSFHLFRQAQLVSKWQLDEHKLVKYLMEIEKGYASNPYHNRVHAADVLRSLHVLVMKGGLLTCGYVDEISVMACYLSAIIHDYEHKGVNNDYLVRMSDSLAVLYNDRSPMENHHLAAAFKLLNSSEFNFMPGMPNKTREQLRRQVIDMVLATDMKAHFSIHSMFQNKMQLSGRPSGGSTGKSMRSSPHNTNDAAGGAKPDEDKSLVLQVALKCADLGHLASPRFVHRKWVCLLEEEFFRQGDNEKTNGLSVSPLMDRDKNGITKSQVGFFDIVALPLFQSFAQAFPDATPMLDAVRDNYSMWREEAMQFNAAPACSK